MKKTECNKCGALKPEDKFPLVKVKGKLYRRRTCQSCLTIREAERWSREREARRERARRYDLNRRDKELQSRPFLGNVERINLGGIAI